VTAASGWDDGVTEATAALDVDGLAGTTGDELVVVVALADPPETGDAAGAGPPEQPMANASTATTEPTRRTTTS
jgi:hypothetical protein